MNISNPHQLVIRRRWSGFGDCEVKVATYDPSAPGSPSKLAVRLARLLSNLGLGSLRFTVDPEWIAADGRPPADPLGDPMLRRFLRANGESLAQEWQSYQSHLLLAAPEVKKEAVVSNPCDSSATPIPVKPDIPRTGLPAWFTSYCAPREGKKTPAGHRTLAVRETNTGLIAGSLSHIAAERQDDPQRQLSA